MNTSSAIPFPPAWPARMGSFLVVELLKGLHAVIRAPEYVFFAALTAMLFRPPDLDVIPIDRICFLLLLAVAAAGILLRREPILLFGASWPMLALFLLGLNGVLSQPYDAKAWSVLAAKWIVPVAMFHIAGLIFPDQHTQRKLEWFSLGVLGYLSLSGSFYLLGTTSLIFPRYILDESIGIHVDRARGPFLQAVANGLCLNILGIIALHSWERRRFRGLLTIVLLVATPLALLATKTRAVWLSAGMCVVLLAFFGGGRSRWVSRSLLLIAGASLCVVQLMQITREDWGERLQDRSPVEFRLQMYRTGWQMFLEKPLLGWGNQGNVQPELDKRITGFHPEYYIFHNTYLELGVERGVLGLALYGWLFFALFRLGATRNESSGGRGFPAPEFGCTWRLVLFAYLLNASAVVMNYQFLNAYVFTIAGILAARQRQQISGGGGHERCVPVEQLSGTE